MTQMWTNQMAVSGAKLVGQRPSRCFPFITGQRFIVAMVREGSSHADDRAESLPIGFLPIYLLVDLTA